MKLKNIPSECFCPRPSNLIILYQKEITKMQEYKKEEKGPNLMYVNVYSKDIYLKEGFFAPNILKFKSYLVAPSMADKAVRNVGVLV